MKRRNIVTLLIALMMVLAACSSTDSDDGTTTTAAPAAAAATTTVAPTTTAAPTTTVAPTTTAAPTTTVPAPSAESLAAISAYEAAWNDGNEDALRALLAADAMLEDSTFGVLDNVDDIVAWSVNRLAMEVEFTIEGCASSGENVKCTAEFDGPVMIALTFVPWRDNYTFSFEDGLIANIKVVCIICWDGEADNRVIDWVEEVDPTAFDGPAGTYFGSNKVLTPERAAFWLEWAPKWEEAGRP